MITIERIIAKVAKLSVNAKTRDHVTDLITQAVAEAMRARTADIIAELEQDMITGRHLDHLGAVDMIRANWTH